jgi:hypothetical protein
MSIEKIVLLLALISFIALASKLSLRIVRRPAMRAGTVATEWSELSISELRQAFRDNMTVPDIAGLLLRTEDEVRKKARELGISLRSA